MDKNIDIYKLIEEANSLGIERETLIQLFGANSLGVDKPTDIEVIEALEFYRTDDKAKVTHLGNRIYSSSLIDSYLFMINDNPNGTKKVKVFMLGHELNTKKDGSLV